MKKKTTQWQKLLNLIESTEVDGLILRKQVLKCSGKKINPRLFYSVDTYRRILTVLQVIEPTDKLGCYRVVHHIPEKEFSYVTARKLAYGK